MSEEFEPANLQTNLEKIQDLLNQYSIPSHPEIINNLEAEYRKEKPDLKEVALLIKSDVRLASGILQIVNSLHTEKNEGIGFVSIQDAVDYLGPKRSEAVIKAELLIDSSLEITGSRMYRFWDSATDVAILAHHLAGKLGFDHLEEAEAYTVGLFRDCGIPILMQAFPYYIDILKDANLAGYNALIESEQECLGFDYQMVGYCLAQHWHLPRIISWAILTHHYFEPPLEDTMKMKEKKNILVSLVYISEIISNRFRRQMHRRESGDEWSGEWPEIHPYVLAHLGIEAPELEDIMGESLDDMEDLLSSYHR